MEQEKPFSELNEVEQLELVKQYRDAKINYDKAWRIKYDLEKRLES